MAHPLYNPYASGNQRATQGQYGLPSGQAGRDPRMAPSHLGPGSSFNSSGASSVTSSNSGGIPPLLLPQSMSYRPSEQNRTIIDENIERSIDMHISRAREEVRLLGKPAHQQTIDSRFTNTQRECLSSGTGMVSYPQPMSSTSASLGQRYPGVNSATSSSDWSSNYERPTVNEHSKFYSSPASSNYASGADGRFISTNEPERDKPSIPGLGDFNKSIPDKLAALTNSSQHKYTSESASNILLHFGLEKEDLEHLISYPEDQITPANLPFILRQIRIEKTKRATTAAQSKPCPGPQPTRPTQPGGPGVRQEDISSAFLQLSNVIDYGHTGKYTGGAANEIGRTSGSRDNSGGSGSMLPLDTYKSSRHGLQPLQKTEVKSSALGFCRDQASAVSSFGSPHSSTLSYVVAPSNDQTKRLQTQEIVYLKDTDIRVVKPEASKPVPLKQPEPVRQSTAKTQQPAYLNRGLHPNRTGLVVIDSNDTRQNKNLSKNSGQGSTVAEQMRKQQTQQQPVQQLQKQPVQQLQKQPVQQLQKQPVQQLQKQPVQQMQKQPVQQMQKQPVQQMQNQQMQKQQMQQQQTQPVSQAMWPPFFPPAKSVPPPSHMQRPVFIPGGPPPIISPSAQPQPIPDLMDLIHLMPPSNRQPPAKAAAFKGLPTETMMHDYAAASPRIFPHTCCLCSRECLQMKDWISHQNSSLHLENCKSLRKQYPDWDGEIALGAAGKGAQASPSTSSQTYQHRQKARHGSRSRSRSRSRSHSSSPSSRRYYSRRSQSPPSYRYTRRSRSRSSSPWYARTHLTQCQSRSRSPERRSSPRRRDDRRSSPKRSRERQSSPRRSNERQSPSRRRNERQSPSRRSDERQSAASRRREERQSPSKRSKERRSPKRKQSSTDSLVKKLLETSAVQSLSNESDLETVVKTLAPALMAELAKMKSSSSSSSASIGGKPSSSSSSSSTAKESTKRPLKAPSSLQSKASSHSKTKSERSTQPTEVALEGVFNFIPHNDLLAAVEVFGKTKSFVRYRSKHRAHVIFEKEEDAKKLKSLKTLNVKGLILAVVRDEETVSTEQKKPPQKHPAVSSASTPPTTSTTTKKVLLPTPASLVPPPPLMSLMAVPVKPLLSHPKAKRPTPGKLMKGAATASQATSLVKKGKIVSAKLMNKMGKTGKLLVNKMGKAGKLPGNKMGKLSAKGHVRKTLVKKKTLPGSKSTTLQRDVKDKESESEVQEAVLKDTAEVVEKKLDKVPDEAKDADPMEVGGMGVEVEEPIEVGSCVEDEEKPTTTEAAAESSPAGNSAAENSAAENSAAENLAAESSADKSNESQPPNIEVDAGPTETSPHLQQSTSSGPESTAQGPESEVEASQRTQQAAGSSTGSAVQARPSGRGVKTKPMKKVKKPAVAVSSMKACGGVTFGETILMRPIPYKIPCFNLKNCFTPRFLTLGQKQLYITNLPDYSSSCYTEDDLVQLLTPFGFQYAEDNIYILPQTSMAFVFMPEVQDVVNVMKASSGERAIFFKGKRLTFNVLANNITLAPFSFYKSLMKLLQYRVTGDGSKTVLVKNISWSETWKLRKTLRKIQSVKNFFPLLNKVFVEFDSVCHADRLGVWYSLLRHAPAHKIYRMKIPVIDPKVLQPSKVPKNAIPPIADAVTGATAPSMEFGIPADTIGPFWVTLKVHPFMYPTTSPWFIIPNHLTVYTLEDIEKASRGAKFPTIMLTGLPAGYYKHEDVAKLVWQYFPKKNLHSLYYNVGVLPLQRRAFVFFPDWTSCCDFVLDHLTHEVSVNQTPLTVHFVLEHIHPASSEEMMYSTLMKWSNAGVPEPKGLEERLLCVETSETSLDVIGVVMDVVASIAPFVGFLPLANRICIEMEDSSAVSEVVEKYKTFSPDCFENPEAWTKVTNIEPLKSLKQPLQDSSDIKNFEANPIKAETPPFLSERPGIEPGPVEQTSDSGGSVVCESITAEPSGVAASDLSIEKDDEEPATEIAEDSTLGSEANEDAVEVEEKEEEESPTTSKVTADVTSPYAASSGNAVADASSPDPPDTAEEIPEVIPELPQINADMFQAITVAVRNHRLTRGSSSKSEEKEIPSKSDTSSRPSMAEDAPQRKGQEDSTDDIALSDTCRFDELNFNMEDFVTVDEVGDDVDDTSPKRHSASSSKQSSRSRRERQSSRAPAGKQTSMRSSKESKTSSSSHSSKSNKDFSSSGSASPKRSKHSFEPSKSSIKPSASASACKASPSSSPLSTETPSGPGQKTQRSKPQSVKASTSLSTCSSSASRETKGRAAATVSIESRSELLLEEKECTVAKSDLKVPTESIAAKAVKSETKMETSSEMPPTQQEQELELSHALKLEIAFNVNTLEEQKQSKDERKEDDLCKHTEMDEGESYQILDSLDDQTDEPMDDEDHAQPSGPEGGQPLHEESVQISDSVDDEVKACPPEHKELEIDGSLQVSDNVTKGEAATGQEDSLLVQDDSSTVKQLFEDHVTSKVETFQVSDTGSTHTLDMDDGKKRKEQEVKSNMLSAESCNAFKDVNILDSQSPNEDQPLQDPDNKDTLKDPDSDVTEQETFEILDSIDDLNSAEDNNQNLGIPIDHISKEDIEPVEEEEDSYQVIDSVEDQPMTPQSETTSNIGKRKVGRGTARKDGKPSKRSGSTTTASKSEEKAVKKYETQTKKDLSARDSETEKEVTEDVVYKIVDSVEDEPVQDAPIAETSGRRRSARGKKEDKITLDLTEASEKPEKATYKILDSVDGENANGEPMPRPTRGKRGRPPKKQAPNEKTTTEDTSPRRRQTPGRESQERNRERTPKLEERVPPKESILSEQSEVGELSKGDATNEVFDSIEAKVIQDDRPAPRKRGRPRKDVTITPKSLGSTLKKGDKDALMILTDEEEATYQILDSVESEAVDDHPHMGQSEEETLKNIDQQTKRSESPTGSPKNEEEDDEPIYCIIDSLDDDHVQEQQMTTEDEMKGTTSSRRESLAEKEDTPICAGTVVEETEEGVEEETLYQIVDDLESSDEPSAAECSGITETPRPDMQTVKSQSDTDVVEVENEPKLPEKDDASSTLDLDEVSEEEENYLDQVSEEEENYPDDAAEEEELRKRLAAVKEKQFAEERGARMTREREERRTRESERRERRSRSGSKGGGGGGGGDSRRGSRRENERAREKEETVAVDPKEMVTLDEVGADDAAEERASDSKEWDEEITERELQALVTLDEFIGEEEDEEDGKLAQNTLEPHPPSQEEEGLVNFLNPETLVTLDEAGDDEEEKPVKERAEETPRSAKRKNDGDGVLEESMNFVTVDEVGEDEEEEEKEAVKNRTKGRAKKRARQTPVRKSTRGKKVYAEDEREEEEREPADLLPPTALDASSSLDKDPSTLSSVGQPEIQKADVETEAAGQADIDAASAGQELQPEHPEDQTLEGRVEEGPSRPDKVGSKQRRETGGPAAKRSRSQSPSVADDVELPPFNPNNPLGQQFVVPKSGYFCNLCSMFYLNERAARDRHCSSQKHYDNLKKHFQKLREKPSSSSQGSVSD